MTKKDYNLVAEAVASVKDPLIRKTFAAVLLNVFLKDNPRFDCTKWLDACGDTKSVKELEKERNERTKTTKAI